MATRPASTGFSPGKGKKKKTSRGEAAVVFFLCALGTGIETPEKSINAIPFIYIIKNGRYMSPGGTGFDAIPGLGRVAASVANDVHYPGGMLASDHWRPIVALPTHFDAPTPPGAADCPGSNDSRSGAGTDNRFASPG
jgi:hypothetical protein